MSQVLVDVFDWWATEHCDGIALVEQSDAVTYAELKAWSSAVSEWLLQQGLECGNRVTVLAANSLEWVIMSQAVLRAGGLLAPINPRFTQSEVDYMIKRYSSRFIFYDEERQTLAQSLAENNDFATAVSLEKVREIRGDGGDWPATARRRQYLESDGEVVIIPTSGSTSRPKGVVYSNRTILDYCSQFALAEAHATNHPGVMVVAPLCTSAGYVVMTQHLVYGGTVYIANAFNPEFVVEKIHEGAITSIMGVPYFWEQMATVEAFAGADMSGLRTALVGGSRCSDELLKTWLGKGVLIRQLYGQTECGGQGTINTVAAALDHPEKCGRGHIFTRIAVINPEGEFCKPGEPGEIVIKGPGNMVRYWDDPEETAKVLKDGWLHTGDLGVLDEDGLLTYLDRLKDIIISGGMNISAAELERVISEYPGIEEVAVIAVPDERFGETPMAIIHSRDDIDESILYAHCKAELSSFKLPKYFLQSSEPLPRLATQKISKPSLRE
ncbi:MAG: class I adenylate-forming enzyme family protein, partial [Parahaliea sp.]